MITDQDDLPSIEAGDWHDGPHQFEDGYDDDGQGIVCVLCAAAKRDAEREREYQVEQSEIEARDRFAHEGDVR